MYKNINSWHWLNWTGDSFDSISRTEIVLSLRREKFKIQCTSLFFLFFLFHFILLLSWICIEHTRQHFSRMFIFCFIVKVIQDLANFFAYQPSDCWKDFSLRFQCSRQLSSLSKRIEGNFEDYSSSTSSLAMLTVSYQYFETEVLYGHFRKVSVLSHAVCLV